MSENNIKERDMEEIYKEVRESLKEYDISKSLSTLENCKGEQINYLSWIDAVKIMNDYTYDWSYEVKRHGEKQELYEVIGVECWKDGVQIVDHLSYLVETEVTVKGIKRSMRLPVINSYSNKVVQGKDLNSQNLNKTIWRCLVKNLAMFGLGESQFTRSDSSEYDTETEQLQQMPTLAQAMNFMVQDSNTKKWHSLKELTDQTYLSKNKDLNEVINILNLFVTKQGVREAQVIIDAIASNQYPFPQ